MSRSVSFALLALALAAGCGGPEISHDDLTRDDSGLMARRYHEDVVRLAGDVDSSPAPTIPGACELPCANHPRIVELTHRICEVWERDSIDEATHFLCEDAQERQRSSQRRFEACRCGE
jgi:hypothetical protein